MTDTDALKERLFDALHEARWVDSYDIARVVLPIVAVEVRKAKAEALREAACGMGEWADAALVVTGDEHDESTWVEMTVGEWLTDRATEYETGDSDDR